MEFETTDRGFKHFASFETDYGHTLRVYESSAAKEPCIWLSVEKGEPRYGGDLPAVDVGIHMTVPQAERLIASLQACVNNHYQTEGE